jgi:hypothetical protein
VKRPRHLLQGEANQVPTQCSGYRGGTFWTSASRRPSPHLRFQYMGPSLFCFVPSLGENLPSHFGGGLHRKTVSHGFAFMVEGRAPHARKRDLAYSGGLPPLAHWAFVCPSMIMSCLGMSTAVPYGRGDRAPPRKPAFASSRAFPRKAILPWIAHPAEGRAPHARKRDLACVGGSPRWATGLSFAPRLIMSCLGMSTARARRPRPSEKTTPQRYFGPFPARPLTRARPPPEGRAPHARKRDLACIGGSPQLGHRAFVCPSMIMSCLGMSTALPRGRGDRAPPRKPPFVPSPAFPR